MIKKFVDGPHEKPLRTAVIVILGGSVVLHPVLKITVEVALWLFDKLT